MLKYLYLLIFIALGAGSLHAATGCVKNTDPSRIYTTLVSGTTYSSSSYTAVNAGCSFILTSTICTVQPGGTSNMGKVSNTSPQSCALDDQAYICLFMLTVLGAYFYHSRRIQPACSR